jgi:amidase
LDREVPDWRRYAKDTAIWNIEKGFELTAQQIIDAELTHTRLYRESCELMARVDALVLPSAQVLPFSIDVDWVKEIEGQEMATYIDWMTVCCAISVTGFPTISVPGGFSSSGLPVGVQIVAGARQDRKLLAIAERFEAATGFAQRRPEGV